MKVRKAIVECFFVLIAPMTVCVRSKFSLLISLRYDSSREGLVGGGGGNKGGVPWDRSSGVRNQDVITLKK